MIHNSLHRWCEIHVFQIFMLCLWSDGVSSWLFLWFLICGLAQVLFLSFVQIVNYHCLIAIFLLLPLDWICSQVHILTHSGRVTQICVYTLQLCKTDDAHLRF